MHAEARAFVARFASPIFEHVLEFGSRDVNGGVRDLFPFAATYHGLDLTPGRGVDEITDAAAWEPDRTYDAVLCCEVLEHAPDVVGLIATASKALDPGGSFIVTCATNPRAPHSAGDGGAVAPDEHYRNIPPVELYDLLARGGLTPAVVEISETRGDLYVHALKDG